jgi:hypothetical protein
MSYEGDVAAANNNFSAISRFRHCAFLDFAQCRNNMKNRTTGGQRERVRDS